MAVSVFGSSKLITGGGATPWTFNLTIPAASGERRVLLFYGSSGGAPGALGTSLPTFNGVGMTAVAGASGFGTLFGNYYGIQVYEILDAALPAAGSYALAGTAPGGQFNRNAVAVALDGADQGSGRATAFSQAAANPITSPQSTNITTNFDNSLVIDGLASWTSAGTFTPGVGQTLLQGGTPNVSTWCETSQKGPISPAGLTPMGWSWSAAMFIYAHGLVEVAPASSGAGAGANVNIFGAFA
jgi:hypothetical protein